MVNNIDYVNIREVLSRLLRHPLLSDLSIESAVQYTLDFIGVMGLPNTKIQKECTIKIEDYRGILPCDLVSINQVRLSDSGECLRSMTSTFVSPHNHSGRTENSFKTQGSVIFTSFRTGKVDISYNAIAVDSDGFPLLPNNSIFLATLELYIKKEWFTILFDMGKISPVVMQNTQQSYAFKAAQCNSEFIIPSVSEMESITNMWSQLIPRMNEFKKGFQHLGDKEYIKLH